MVKKVLKQILYNKVISNIIYHFLLLLPFCLRSKIGFVLNTSRNKRKNQPYQSGAFSEGVNLFGYLKAQMGLGQGARLMAHAIAHVHLPHTFINVCLGNPASHNEKEFEPFLTKYPFFNTNIVHINPEQTPLLRQLYSHRAWDKRYNIAFWLWELESFPSNWNNQFDYFDEIWTPSTFTSSSISKSTHLPVITIPYGIQTEDTTCYSRCHFRLPEDQFLFLCMYDVNSTMERKNPIGAIEAFFSAFPANSMDVGLVIKINNATKANLAELNAYIGERKNIFIISQLMSKTEVQSLIKVCDVFVSLHRSEGFGLVMAEAMNLGIPVIATNWSANTDFMKPDNSCLVDFRFTDVNNLYYRSKRGQRWADPNVEHAATYMKQLFTHENLYERISHSGQDYIQKEFSMQASAKKIKTRLQEIGVISR